MTLRSDGSIGSSVIGRFSRTARSSDASASPVQQIGAPRAIALGIDRVVVPVFLHARVHDVVEDQVERFERVPVPADQVREVGAAALRGTRPRGARSRRPSRASIPSFSRIVSSSSRAGFALSGSARGPGAGGRRPRRGARSARSSKVRRAATCGRRRAGAGAARARAAAPAVVAGRSARRSVLLADPRPRRSSPAAVGCGASLTGAPLSSFLAAAAPFARRGASARFRSAAAGFASAPSRGRGRRSARCAPPSRAVAADEIELLRHLNMLNESQYSRSADGHLYCSPNQAIISGEMNDMIRCVCACCGSQTAGSRT